MSLFAGARLPGWQAYLVPLALMAITDPILSAYYGVHPFGLGQLFIYTSFLISVWIGRRLKGTENVLKIAGCSLASSTQFFLITNFPSWMSGHHYPPTAAGLMACYAAAIPFFRWTMLSDLIYSAILFGLHAWLTRTIAARERVASAA